MILKTLAGLVCALALVIAAGVSGFTFTIWPTFIADQPLEVTPRMLSELAALKQERKFLMDTKVFYPGARNEAERVACQAAVDAVIDSVVRELPKAPRSATVLGIFKQALSSFDTLESEERDQFLVYLQRVMRIAGVSSSHELFNVWRYGFPYGWLIRT
jgi:hypothetical protein